MPIPAFASIEGYPRQRLAYPSQETELTEVVSVSSIGLRALLAIGETRERLPCVAAPRTPRINKIRYH